MTPASDASPGQAPARKARFLRNVIWSWASVLITLLSALVLSPYIIRKLGDENYGLWALTIALVEYYWLLDLGLRSATVRYAAHYSADSNHAKINEVVNSSLFYSLSIAPLLIGGTVLAGPLLARALNITHPSFNALLAIVITAWALVGIFTVFTSCLEGLQHFDATSQSSIVALTLRTGLTFLLLWKGYGIIGLAVVTCGAQVLMHILCLLRLRRLFPHLALSPRNASLTMLKTMFRYGIHSVVASLGQRILSQAPPLLIGYFLPTRFVGYYSAPMRFLDYAVEGVAKVGNVSNPNAAALMAAEQAERVLRLSVVVNRYCLLLFQPLALFLGFYALPLLSVWINPGFAANSAGVLIALLPGMVVANAAQYNSASILFGIGRHQAYSRLLLAEALLCVFGLAVLLPRYGILAAAWLSSLLMLINRGLITGWLLSSELKCRYFQFMRGVYAPLLLAVPMGFFLYFLRLYVPGRNWGQLALAGVATMAAYTPLTWGFLLPEHRSGLARILHLPIKEASQ